MPKKILVLCGSPNKNGNTNTVVTWIKRGAEEMGNTVDVVDAASLKYKANGCTACMGCKKTDAYECVIEDEAQPVLKKMPEYDVLILATPLYFFGPTAQLKVLTDRIFSLVKFDLNTHEVLSPLLKKTLILVSTGGSDMFGALEETVRMWANFSKMHYDSFLVPFAGESGFLKDNEELRQKAIEFGRSFSERA